MKGPVIAIGLDAADPKILQEWVDKGLLPNLSRLINEGSFEPLETYDWYRAETPWTTFLTGRSPQDTGYWSPIKYQPEKYNVEIIKAFNFREFPPFYAYLGENKAVIFDMPQGPIVENFNGSQVLAWGTHSGQTESISSPPELYQKIVDKHGSHPLLNNDQANCYSPQSMQKLYDKMKVGIDRRAKASIDLITTEEPDFFLTIFGEAHVAGHYFWHLGQDHPLHAEMQQNQVPDLLLKSFQDIDTAIGRMIEGSPENARFVIFSAHGMGINVMDLPSVVFLPEFLHRLHFQNSDAIGAQNQISSSAPVKATDEILNQGFSNALWRRTREKNRFLNITKRLLGMRWYHVIKRRLPRDESPGPKVRSPFELRTKGQVEPFQCSVWYREFWPQMEAFSLPSFSEGYIRINLKGREPKGIVAPEDYDKVCEKIIKELESLVDARTGKPVVERIIRTRVPLGAATSKSPDADLVVVWSEETASDTLSSPSIGTIGPLPFLRTGSHRAGGFILTHSKQGSIDLLSQGHAIDLAPTILDLIGITLPPQLEGKSLIASQQKSAS